MKRLRICTLEADATAAQVDSETGAALFACVPSFQAAIGTQFSNPPSFHELRKFGRTNPKNFFGPQAFSSVSET